MKICVAQTRPVKGDIQTNIDHHKKLINLAIENGASMIIFPELSITGYEPELADALATDISDKRLNIFQQISNASHITIGVGMPVRNNEGIYISMIIFQPQQERLVYSKKYLHEDEEPYFTSGENFSTLPGSDPVISFAICYELSISLHSENTYKNAASVYIASVAKNADRVKKAISTLSAVACKYSMTVLMSNSVGHCDNFESAGNSSAWNKKGELLAQLNDRDEGILMIDSITGEIIERLI